MVDSQALKNKPKGLFFLPSSSNKCSLKISDRAPSLVKKLTRLYANKYKIPLDFFLCIDYNHYRKRGKEQ